MQCAQVTLAPPGMKQFAIPDLPSSLVWKFPYKKEGKKWSLLLTYVCEGYFKINSVMDCLYLSGGE